jgi:hypothetical protein
MSLTIIEREDHSTMAKRITAKIVSDRQPLIYGYCRVSTAEQRDQGISLDEQKQRIEGRCLEQGWTLTELYVEGGVSGSVPFAKRPQELMRRLLPGDIVISPKLSLGARRARDHSGLQDARDPPVAARPRRRLQRQRNLGADADGPGRGCSQFERTRLAERIIDAKGKLGRTGRHQGGTRPFGFKLGPPAGRGRAPVLIPDPVAQKAIRDIVQMRHEGKTLMAIKAAMAERGHRMSHQTIDNLVKRARLAGAA